MTTPRTGIGIERAAPGAPLDAYYDSMYRDREAIFPQALELDFWRDHFVTRACRDSGVLSGHVVDLGCGTGEADVLLVEQLPDVERLTGVDISDLGLSYARQHRTSLDPALQQRLSFVKADITSTGLTTGCADAVLLSHTLEHLPNPAPVLREMGRLLRPDGLAVVVVPHGHHHDDPDHRRHLDLEGWSRLLRRYATVVRGWASEEDDQLAFVIKPRQHAPLTLALRVRDEADQSLHLLDHVSGLVDRACVLDDRSLDGTGSRCAAHPLVAQVLRNDDPTDEVRDKNALLDAVLATDAEWVLALDADERLEPGGAELLRRLVDTAPPWVDVLSLDCLHLWDTPSEARFDGPYGRDIRHPRLYRTEAVRETAARFEAGTSAAGLHCGSVPAALRDQAVPTPVRFLHHGYLEGDVRRRKSAFYAREDAAAFAAGGYAHLLTPPEVLVPVSDRRDVLDAHQVTWADEGALTSAPEVGPDDSLVIVDGRLPEETRRAVHHARSGFRVQVGGAPSAWADLRVATRAEADAVVPGAQAVGFDARDLLDGPDDHELTFTGERCVPWSDDLQMIYEHLHRYTLAARHVAGRDVLDLASGEGYGAALLAGAGARRVVGLEIDPAAVRHARTSYPEVTFVEGSMCDPEAVEAGAFDVVTCFEAIEHVEDQESLRRLVQRALRPGGLVLVSTPDTAVYTDQLHQDNPFHVAELDREGFARWLSDGWANVALLTQSTVVGSVVEPLDSPGHGFVHEGVRKASRSDWVTGTPAAPPYLIGVASDGPLPLLGPDLMSDVDLGAVRAAMRRVYDLEDELRQARLQLARSEGWEVNVASLRQQVVELTDQLRAADRTEELAAAQAWRAEFEASRAGRLIGAWRAMRDALKPGSR